MTKIKLYLIFLFLCSLVTQAQTTAWDGLPAEKIANEGGGTGAEDSPIEIASVSELAYLAQQTNSGGEELTLENGESISGKTNFAGVYFKLTEDIDLEGREWTPIGITNNPFKGELDGGNHKILNLSSINTNDYNYAGLFGRIEKSTVKNIHIEIASSGLHVEGAENVGALAGYVVESEITNCSVEGGYITGDEPMLTQLAVGGLTGQLEKCNITDCSNTVNVKGIKPGASALLVGGITGTNLHTTITNCQFSGSVAALDEREDKSSSYVGGITGASDLNTVGGYTPRESTISECTANVNITAGTYAGGIVGYYYDGTIEKCTVEGIISTKETEGHAGGIMGHNRWGGSVIGCYNLASVTSSEATGGIVGFAYAFNALTISKCWSSGNITAPYAGGIAGFIGLGSIEECYTSGNITGNDLTGCYAGGIAGYVSSEAINNCSSTANVTAMKEGNTQAFAGGIIGQGSKYDVYSGTSIQNCYATGKISSNYAAGGIAGENENGSITQCVALNKEGLGAITETGTNPILKTSDEMHFGRIAGIESGTFTSNFASPLIPGDWINNHTGKDGDDLTSDNFTHGEGNAFDQWDKEKIWSFDDEGIHLPILKVFGENTGDGKPIHPLIPKSDFLEFSLTYDKDLQNGSITVTSSSSSENPIPPGTSIAGGTVLTITVTPNDGYDLVSLTVNNKEFTSGDTYTVDGDIEIKAEFSIRAYTIYYDEPSKGIIRVTYSDNGTETEVLSGKSLNYGTEITIEAIPESGYRIESLTVNDETFSSGSSLLLKEDIFIEATFGKIPDPVPDYPVFTYYTIKLPKVEGVTTNPSAGTYIYREGSDFSFTLTLDSAYNQSEPIVKLSDGTILEPDRWGYYTIWGIDQDWKVCITEIKLNPDPVANETIKSGIDIKVLEDGLHIRLSQPIQIQIVTPGGQIIRRLQLPAGDNHFFSLPKGIYFIQSKGEKAVKVVI